MELGTLKAWYDPATRVVNLSGAGLWSLEETLRYQHEIERVLRIARSEGPAVRILADNRCASVQAKEVVDATSAFTKRVLNSCDKLAIVVDTILAKMQMRRSIDKAETEVFLSLEDALAWLLNDHR